MKSNLEKLRVLFDDGSEHTYSDLTNKLSIDERQLRRLINTLRKDGIPVEEKRVDRKKVFYIPANHQRTELTDLNLSQNELKALTISVKASGAILAGTPHFQPLKSVFEKLLDKVDPVAYIFEVEEQFKEWYFEEGTYDQINLDYFRLIEQAMQEKQSVRIDYTKGGTGQKSFNRKVDPYFITKRGRSWMFIAYCHERKDKRNFSFMGLDNVRLCDPKMEKAYFEIPQTFDPKDYFRKAFNAINNGDPFVLRILIEPDKAGYFHKRSYHPSQKIEKEQDDQRLIVSYELEGFEEMRSFCQGWGTGITVLDPPELVKRLREEATELANRYSLVKAKDKEKPH